METLIDPAALPPPGVGVVVAYSGGLDSTVLLHQLAQRYGKRVRAVHVHHGLQAVADDWATHCIAFAGNLGVACEVQRVRIDGADPRGPEAAARAARYDALRGAMRPGDWLALAHHRDDQAETVLLRLLRGSGLTGLAAMRALTPFPPGQLWRPLLSTPRSQLERYAAEHGLRWIEDPHNRDARYTRSWLRQQVMPNLRQRLPQAEASLARAAAHAAEAVDLLDELAAIDRAKATHPTAGACLSITALLRLSGPRRRNLLRHWLAARGAAMPDAAMLARIDAEMLTAASDAEPLLHWAGVELRRYRDALFVGPLLPAPPVADWQCAWSEDLRIELPPGCGVLKACAPPPVPLLIRMPRAGEQLRPTQASRRRSLKNLFQERATPPWLRPRMPVIECQGEVALIPGLGIATTAARPLVERGWQVTWLSGWVPDQVLR